MTEAENAFFYTAVLSLLRMNGGSFTIAAEDIAEGDFRIRWDRTPAGLCATEIAVEVETPTPATLGRKPKRYRVAGGRYIKRPRKKVKK